MVEVGWVWETDVGVGGLGALLGVTTYGKITFPVPGKNAQKWGFFENAQTYIKKIHTHKKHRHTKRADKSL